MIGRYKNISLFIVLLSISTLMSQEPIKDISIGNKWFYQQTGWAHGGINLNANITFEVIADTVIDNLEYSILLEKYVGENGHSHIYRFYERADSIKLEYIYPCQQAIGWENETFYDFSLNIGDTIFNSNGYSITIDKGDSTYWVKTFMNIDIVTNQCLFDVYNTNIIHVARTLGYIKLVSTGLDNSYVRILKGAIIDGFIYGTTDLEQNDILKLYSLEQNYPNPFNPNPNIKYKIPIISFATIKVYDVLGNEIATIVNEEKTAGGYEAEFNGSNLTSGIYFYQLRAGNYVKAKKMVLLK